MSEILNSDQSSKKIRTKSTVIEGIPSRCAIEDCLKTIKVLSDKGGTGKADDLEAAFGDKKNRYKLTSSLSSLARLGIIEKSGSTFSLGNVGGAFVVASEEEKKRILAEKVISYPHYKDVFIRLNNEVEKSVKKEDITDIWINISGGGKRVRQFNTTTFSSLAAWSGLVEDSGRIIKLKDFGIQLFEGKTSSSETIPDQSSPTQPLISDSSPTQQTSSLICPICNSIEIGLKSEDIVQSIQTKTGNLIYLRNTFYCRSCRSEFTRLHQQFHESPLSEV